MGSKWQEAKRSVLAALDVAGEYRALGVDVTSSQPTAKGWICCRSADVEEDKSPSAGICITESSPFFGRYKDFRTGRTCDFFAFFAERRGCAYGDAVKHFAARTGVKLPDGKEEWTAERLDHYEATPGTLLTYAQGKPGVTVQALKEVGSRGGRWPRNLAPEKTNWLLVTPMYGTGLLDLEPTGYHLVAANPRARIRKFQGQGNDDSLHKTLTLGEPGLMGEEGLARLEEAEVINLVEGITDLYAAQAVLGPWREADPANRSHVVLSAGACSYHPKSDWLTHFAGKEVRLWYDVGDPGDEGQLGAKVWVAALLLVARAVRNVQLPLGQDGGKNDLRAWLVEAGRTYADMDSYASTFAPIEVDDAEAQRTPQDALLESLGLLVLGEHEHSQRVEVFSLHTKKSATIQDLDKLSIVKLIQLIGLEAVEQFVYDGKEVPPGKFDLRTVRAAIAGAASRKQYHDEEILGAGLWEWRDQMVLVRSGQVGLLNGARTKIEVSQAPYLDRCVLDIGQAAKEWVDFEVLNRYLLAAQEPTWCETQLEELSKILGCWYWRQESARLVTAGLVLATWLQTTWEWRPAVLLTGSSSTGKSNLLSEVIHPLFGKLGLYFQKASEAGIRQSIRHHGFILLVDEFEKDMHRQKVYELLRTSSRGGEVVKGKADHQAVRFKLKHLAWLCAIESGLKKQADLNRFIKLELDVIPRSTFGHLELPSREQVTDLGLRLLAVSLRVLPEAKRLARMLRFQVIDGVPNRLVEGFSVPIAIYAAAHGCDNDQARHLLERVLSHWDVSSQSEQDEVALLAEILTTEVLLDHGRRATVESLLQDISVEGVTARDGAIDALSRHGIRRISKRSGHPERRDCLWFCPRVVSRNLLKQSEFSGQAIAEYLQRLPGARTSQQRLGGSDRYSGIEVPLNSLDHLFAQGKSDEMDR